GAWDPPWFVFAHGAMKTLARRVLTPYRTFVVGAKFQELGANQPIFSESIGDVARDAFDLHEPLAARVGEERRRCVVRVDEIRYRHARQSHGPERRLAFR